MKALLYEYAKNERNAFTHIDDAITGQYYSCIECGEPLIIKDGSKKRKHFAHKSNSNCDGESYIHKIWKWRLKEKFYINYDLGEIVCPNCKQNTYLEINNKIVSALKIIKSSEYEKLHSIKIGDQIVDELMAFLLRLFQVRFGCEIKIFN